MVLSQLFWGLGRHGLGRAVILGSFLGMAAAAAADDVSIGNRCAANLIKAAFASVKQDHWLEYFRKQSLDVLLYKVARPLQNLDDVPNLELFAQRLQVLQERRQEIRAHDAGIFWSLENFFAKRQIQLADPAWRPASSEIYLKERQNFRQKNSLSTLQLISRCNCQLVLWKVFL